MGMNFLVIDDNKSMSEALSKLLKLAGHECITSADGRNGLTLIQQQKFDAVILDLAMPRFSGLNIIEALEKDGKIKEQKIIVLTATSPSDELMNDLKGRGVYMVLNKPVEMDVILGIIKKMDTDKS